MSIRLSKIAKELNVGVSTVVDFLKRKGHSIPSDLNYKLTDDEADMLYQEFSKDKKMKIDSEKVSQKRHVKEKRGSVAIEGFGEEEDVIKPVVSEDQKPKIKQVGKIDLDSLNSSKKAKVELQIQLAKVCGQRPIGGLLHKIRYAGVLHRGRFTALLGVHRTADHLIRRTAATVAEAVGHQHAVALSLVPDGFQPFAHALLVDPGLDGVEVDRHRRAVDAQPEECLIRECIGVVPAELGGEEILDTAGLQNLRQRRGITKGIRQPEGVRLIAEFLAQISLTPDELTAERLGAREVSVTLNPSRAIDLKSSLENELLNL